MNRLFSGTQAALALTILAMSALVAPRAAQAMGAFELGFSFGYNRVTYSEESYTFTRRWGVNLGYHFNETSGIELSFNDVMDRNKISNYEDTTFNDRIYSANWVQSFLPRRFRIQPYIKLGVGQLNRDAAGTYYTGSSPPARVDSITVVTALGLRIYVTPTFSIRSEIVSYLIGANPKTFKDNFAFQVGTSIYF